MVILLSLLIGLAIGCINGALVSILGLQPFITTLIMMLAGRGLAKVITSGQNTDASSVAGGAPLKWMANGFILGIPANFVIALVIVALVGLLCRKTAMGMMIESVGINPEASRMTGIKPKKILFLVYAVSGVLAAVAGLFATASVMEDRRGQDRPGSRNVRHPRSRDRWNLAARWQVLPGRQRPGRCDHRHDPQDHHHPRHRFRRNPAFFAAVVIVMP